MTVPSLSSVASFPSFDAGSPKRSPFTPAYTHLPTEVLEQAHKETQFSVSHRFRPITPSPASALATPSDSATTPDTVESFASRVQASFTPLYTKLPEETKAQLRMNYSFNE